MPCASRSPKASKSSKRPWRLLPNRLLVLRPPKKKRRCVQSCRASEQQNHECIFDRGFGFGLGFQALTVFDGAVAAVTALMKTELYPRFIKSDGYTRLARGVTEKRLAIDTEGKPARASLSTNEQSSPLASPSAKGARTNSATVPPSPSAKSATASPTLAPAAAPGDKKAAPAPAAAADAKQKPEPAVLFGLKKWVNHNQFYKVRHRFVFAAVCSIHFCRVLMVWAFDLF
jgi:hypothetical protein